MVDAGASTGTRVRDPKSAHQQLDIVQKLQNIFIEILYKEEY